MSSPNLCSPGPLTYVLSAQQMAQRSASPADYPCFKETGVYQRHPSGCRMRCCIVPAKTPDDEDTPKWAAQVAAEHAAEQAAKKQRRQPDFSDTPAKTVFTHDIVSGRTPDGAPGYVQTNIRVNKMHEGVPGRSEEDPVFVDTPARHKP